MLSLFTPLQKWSFLNFLREIAGNIASSQEIKYQIYASALQGDKNFDQETLHNLQLSETNKTLGYDATHRRGVCLYAITTPEINTLESNEFEFKTLSTYLFWRHR